LKTTKIYYWSPFLSPIATCKAVLNSAYSLTKYDIKYKTSVINFFGEFNQFKLNNKNINFIDYYKLNFSKKFPYKGKIRSRLSFILMFLMGFFPLKKLLKKNNPDYIIIHLITSLPLILLIFFKFKTKFILRISGFPRMNFIRKFLWKIAFKKIYLITCPTINTMNFIKSLDLIEESKIKLLYDPVLIIKEINQKKRKKLDLKNYYLAVGRLTKQKNFLFLCRAFLRLIENNNNIKLLIAGNGEQKEEIEDYISKNNLSKNIILLGYIDNIYPYFKNSNGFILTSLWEDPGFVLVEASYCRAPIFSSDAWPGPVELIKNNYNGIVFNSNNIESFLNQFKIFLNQKKNDKFVFNNLKMCKKFTLFNHYKKLISILN
jgi:glycosyltransferase involved in cell wall biosynthesis